MIGALLRSLQPAEASLLRRALLAMAASALAQGAALALLPMAFASLFDAAAGLAPWRWAGAFAGFALLCLGLRRHAQLAGYRADSNT
ncbi:ABC transporter ATP-binding protein, partial [Pseudomonas protegens]